MLNKNSNIIFILMIIVGALGPVFDKGGTKAPFKADVPSMLIIEETAARDKLTADQRAAILGTKPGSVDAIIKERGGQFLVIDIDNSKPEDLTLMPQWVKDAALVAKKDRIPWVVAAGPHRGVNEALPETMPEILKAVEAAK